MKEKKGRPATRISLLLFLAFFIGALPARAADRGQETSVRDASVQAQAPAPKTQAMKPDPKLKDKLAEFRLFMNAEMKRWEVPGMAVGIFKDGQIILAEGFGYRNAEKKLPVTPDTIFAIGSSSKAFTTMGLGILAEEGKIDWDKPVRTYLPEFKLKDEIATERMTVRDLVCHRSGLPRHDMLWYGSALSRKDIVDRLRYLDFSADFRETFQYNNLMFLTAGYLIGRVTNSSWEEFTRSRIFNPLGMTNSNFSVADSQKSDDYSLPYAKKDEAIIEIPFRTIDTVGPAGSINSSVRDMLKWVRFHLDKGKVGETQVISEAGQKEMYTPAMAMRSPMLSVQPDSQSEMSYGLGWFIETYRGHRIVHHGGAIDGFYYLNGFLPGDGLGVVIFSNLGGSPLVQISMGYILDMMLDLKPVWEKLSQEKFEKAKKDREKADEEKKKKEDDRVPGTKPSHALDAYADVYEHPAYGEIPIILKDTTLTGKFNSIEFNLEHWHYDQFKTKDIGSGAGGFDGLPAMFQTNNRGDIDRFTISLESSVAPIVFTKKTPAEMNDPEFLSQFVGDYEVMGAVISVVLKGNALFVSIPSQATVELVPYKGTEFNFKGVEGVSLKFILEQGKATEVVVSQPGGTFRGKRK
ncbi:MAG: serine hydrolase [Candidatus Aminicenantes bacterium]|nr:serine hydrolase [Candidatus Aminicenantes bacterium]